MNKLSKRLEQIASFITKDNKKIIDIGCDHGLLSIYLANKYNDIKIIASDINKNALNNAVNNIRKELLEDRIETRLGSGLDIVKINEIDTIIISGMGTTTIVNILNNSKEKLNSVNTMIIQSNNDLYLLRKYITKLGFFIEDESLVEDKNIIYTIIKFSKGNKKYNYKELYLGPVLIRKNDKLFKKQISKELIILKNIMTKITKGHYLYKLKIKRNIKILDSIK